MNYRVVISIPVDQQQHRPLLRNVADTSLDLDFANDKQLVSWLKGLNLTSRCNATIMLLPGGVAVRIDKHNVLFFNPIN